MAVFQRFDPAKHTADLGGWDFALDGYRGRFARDEHGEIDESGPVEWENGTGHPWLHVNPDAKPRGQRRTRNQSEERDGAK